MAISELAAMEAAYSVLQPLNAAERRRALQWLSDALGHHHSPAPAEVQTANGQQPQRATVSVEQSPAAATPRRRTRKAALASTPARVKKAASAEKTTRAAKPRSKVSASKQAPGDGGERPYRRMPEANEVMAAYRQVGTITGLAEHFDVPRYTAQSWARGLRTQGFDIGRTG